MKKGDILLVISSFVFSVFLAETILYVAKIQPYTEFRRGVKSDHSFRDIRSKAQFVSDSRANGIEMVPDIPPHTFIKSNGLGTKQEPLFPVGSISNSPTVYCNVYGEHLVYQSDQYGFRNPNSIYAEKDLDVLIVGDSFSAGHCEKNDIGTLLRQKGLNTLNIAYFANGPLIELAALREYGFNTKAKVLLWIYFEGNDLKNLKQESVSPILMNYLNPDFTQSLKSKQGVIDKRLSQHVNKRLSRELDKEESRFSLKNILQLKGLRFKVRRFFNRTNRTFYPLEEFKPYLPLLSDVLSRAKNDAEAAGTKMFFVYLPQRERYGGPVNELRLHTFRPDVLEIVNELDIPLIDFGDVLDNTENPRDYFPYGIKGHYNQTGYDLLSEQILPRLKPYTTNSND